MQFALILVLGDASLANGTLVGRGKQNMMITEARIGELGMIGYFLTKTSKILIKNQFIFSENLR